MRYLLAIVAPPVAVLRCKRRGQAILNLALTLCFWVPGALHAAVMVFDHLEEERARRVIEAIRLWQKQARSHAGTQA